MSETEAPHPDDIAVDRFAAAMKAKLAKKRAEGYGGWDNPEECTIEHLSGLLINHLAKGDPVDIGNFAMMIHQRGSSVDRFATGSAEPKLYGPYGYLIGCRALSEDTWRLENQPLESNDKYFSIPLYAKVDIPFPASPAPAPLPVAVKAILDQVAEMLRVYENEAPHLLNDELANLMALAKGACSALFSPVGGMEGKSADVEVKMTEAQQQAQAALDKVMNCRFSNFDAGAVIHWAERGLYQVKTTALFSPTPSSDITALREENDALRQIISDCAASLPNGAYVAPSCSVDFMKHLPKEIGLVVASLQHVAKGERE